MKVGDDSTEEVKQGGGDGRVWSHRVMHDQDCRLDVHDVVFGGLEKQPVVEKGQLGIAAKSSGV